jgi:hypothetical protein
MGQRMDFIAVAKGELGVIEGPKENETKYGAFTKANFLPWCGSFVNWCANEVGLKIPNCVSTKVGAEAFMKKSQWEKAEEAIPLPGDVVFFDFPNDGVDRISHIGIVVGLIDDKQCVTIEGNTSGTGDQRNGGMVMVKVRNIGKEIVGFGIPKFVPYKGEHPTVEMPKSGEKPTKEKTKKWTKPKP